MRVPESPVPARVSVQQESFKMTAPTSAAIFPRVAISIQMILRAYRPLLDLVVARAGLSVRFMQRESPSHAKHALLGKKTE